LTKKIVSALAGRTVHCILFDLGSTLWTHNKSFDQLSQQRAVRQHMLAILRQHIDSRCFPYIDDITLGEQIAKAIRQRIYELYMLNTRLEPDFATGVVEALQQVGFPPVDRTVGAEIFEALRTRSFNSRTLFEDALMTLATLKQRNFLLGVVTNRQYGGPLFVEDIRNFGLLDYFEELHIAISSDLNVRKPNPIIFRHALDALGVAPEEAVMVGDSLGADVVGAKELNIVAVWKPSPRVFAQVRAAQEQEYTTQSFESRLIESARQYEKSRGRPIPEDIMPDLIIEHLRELLDVFVEVGKQ